MSASARPMKFNPAFLDDESLIRSFVVRGSELDRILEIIRENTGAANQHLLIIGPRGIGKTTLVVRAAAEVRADPVLRDAWVPVVFGEEPYQVTSPGEFWLEALFHLGQQTGDARWQRAHDELLLERDENRLRARAMAQLMDFADEQRKRLLLIVENLNMLVGSQITANDAWALRHTLMNEPRLMLLATATSRFSEIDDYNQALYELFRIMELAPLDQAESRVLWKSATGADAPAHQIRPLQILTGGNPRLIRILSEFAATASFSSLMEDLTRLVDAHTEYFKHHLDNLPPQERKVFVVLADLWDPSTARAVAETARIDVNTTSALLKRLAARGAVTTPYKRGRAQYYQVTERMYNIYHLMRRRGPAASRVHAVVRFMVSLYRDEELVQRTRSLVEEAAQLAIGKRTEHFAAYEAIVRVAGRPSLAEEILSATRNALVSMPDAPATLLALLSKELQAQPDRPTAGLQSRSTSELDKTLTADTLVAEGNNLFFQRLVAEAIELFDRAIALDSTNPAAWVSKGVALMSQFEFETALKCFEHALTSAPDRVETLLNQGVVLSLLGRPAEAIEAFDRIIAQVPDDVSAWINRGNALYAIHRDVEALDAYHHALTINASDENAWFNKALVLLRLGQIQAALDAYREATRLDPENPMVWGFYADALLASGQGMEAIVSYDRAISLNQGNTGPLLAKGIALEATGLFAEAVEAYDAALALKPDSSIAWFNRGNALLRLSDNAEAIRSYERAIELDPDDADVWFNKASALPRLGLFDEAIEACDRALAINPSIADGWNLRGLILTAADRFDEAIEAFDRELSRNPKQGEALLGRARVNLRLDRNSEAEADLRAVLEFTPSELSAWFLLLELLFRSSRLEEASALARKLVATAELPSDLLNILSWSFLQYGRAEDMHDAESWSRHAVEIMTTNDGAIRHTYASILGKRGNWAAALAQAAEFLRDEQMLTAHLGDSVDFFIDAIAAGFPDKVLAVIEEARQLQAFEPLVVAIQYLEGGDVDVAREVSEIARDVVQRVQERKKNNKAVTR